MDIYSVIVKENWIEPIRPYLQGFLKDDRNLLKVTLDKGTARQCLDELENVTIVMDKMKTDWAQGSFTTRQMHLIREVASYLDIDEAVRRFSI